METVEIREDTYYTPYCTVCKAAIVVSATNNHRLAEVIGTRHELEEHPDIEEEDA